MSISCGQDQREFPWPEFLAEHEGLLILYARCVIVRGGLTLKMNEAYEVNCWSFLKHTTFGIQVINDRICKHTVYPEDFVPWCPKTGEKYYNSHLKMLLTASNTHEEWSPRLVPLKFHRSENKLVILSKNIETRTTKYYQLMGV